MPTNCRSAAAFTGGYTAAVLAGVGLAGGLSAADGVPTDGAVATGVAAGLALFAASIPLSFCLRTDKAMTFRAWGDIVALAGTRKLRRTFKLNPTARDTRVHVALFDVFLKYLCCPALLGLAVAQVVTDAAEFESGYQDYPAWAQSVVGVGVLGVLFAVIVVVAAFPQLWDWLSGVGGGDNADADELLRRQLKLMVCACSIHVLVAVDCSSVLADERLRGRRTLMVCACSVCCLQLTVLQLLLTWLSPASDPSLSAKTEPPAPRSRN